MEDHVSPSAEGDDPDGPVGRHVTVPFPKSAEPAVLEADQIGEGAMGSPVPDLPDRNQLGARGPPQPAARDAARSNGKNGYHFDIRFSTSGFRDARDTNW